MALAFVAGLISEIALAFQAISIAFPHWIKVSTHYLSYQYGLWITYYCRSGNCMSYSISDVVQLQVVRVFAILGALALAAAGVVSFIKLCVERKAVLSIIAVVLNAVAAGAILIAVSVFVGTIAKGPGNFHFAFYFEIVSMLLAVGAGVLHVFEIMQSRRSLFQ